MSFSKTFRAWISKGMHRSIIRSRSEHTRAIKDRSSLLLDISQQKARQSPLAQWHMGSHRSPQRSSCSSVADHFSVYSNSAKRANAARLTSLNHWAKNDCWCSSNTGSIYTLRTASCWSKPKDDSQQKYQVLVYWERIMMEQYILEQGISDSNDGRHNTPRCYNLIDIAKQKANQSPLAQWSMDGVKDIPQFDSFLNNEFSIKSTWAKRARTARLTGLNHRAKNDCWRSSVFDTIYISVSLPSSDICDFSEVMYCPIASWV